MRTGVRNALILGSLVAAAGLTWHWSRPSAEHAGSDGDRTAALGYYMLDAVLSGTNAAGRMDFEVRTARLTEIPAEDRVVLEDLEIAHTLDDSAWLISAGTATAPPDGSRFALEGDVVLRLERATGDPYVVRVPRLELDRALQVARASGQIEIVVGASRLTAKTLEIDLNARSLRLESVQGMKTSQITNAIAAAALSTAAAAQDGGEAGRDGATGSFAWESSECAEECVIQGFEFTGANWRLRAREARAAGIDSLGEGEVRLADVHFAFDDMSLDTPSAVFEFANDAIVEAALTGDMIRFDSDGARFDAMRIVFRFDGGELATAELSGKPVLFEDLSAERRTTATAETLSYDYRKRELRTVGTMTFKIEGRVHLNCIGDFSYAVGTSRWQSGACEGAGAQETRDGAPPQDGGAPDRPAVDPASDRAP